MTSNCKDIEIRKPEFLSKLLNSFIQFKWLFVKFVLTFLDPFPDGNSCGWYIFYVYGKTGMVSCNLYGWGTKKHESSFLILPCTLIFSQLLASDPYLRAPYSHRRPQAPIKSEVFSEKLWVSIEILGPLIRW